MHRLAGSHIRKNNKGISSLREILLFLFDLQSLKEHELGKRQFGARNLNPIPVALAKIASDVKAADIKFLFVKPLVYWTKFFLITTVFSRPQIDAITIRTRINDLAEKQYGKFATGDTKANSWTLLDFGDIVVHIFLPERREIYNLEEFYSQVEQ